jgi:hypothetical protein
MASVKVSNGFKGVTLDERILLTPEEAFETGVSLILATINVLGEAHGNSPKGMRLSDLTLRQREHILTYVEAEGRIGLRERNSYRKRT